MEEIEKIPIIDYESIADNITKIYTESGCYDIMLYLTPTTDGDTLMDRLLKDKMTDIRDMLQDVGEKISENLDKPIKLGLWDLK